MQSFFYLLLNNPDTYEKILTEIDKAHEAGKLSEPTTYAEAQELPYFQACLKEAMRMRPAVGLNITRFVPPGGLEIDGEWCNADTEVAVNGWVLHRDKDTFGQDADVYRPERWLENDGKAKEMERHMYQVKFSTSSPFEPVYTDCFSDSLVAAAICALVGTLRSWRSTSCCPN